MKYSFFLLALGLSFAPVASAEYYDLPYYDSYGTYYGGSWQPSVSYEHVPTWYRGYDYHRPYSYGWYGDYARPYSGHRYDYYRSYGGYGSYGRVLGDFNGANYAHYYTGYRRGRDFDYGDGGFNRLPFNW